ncbi:MAG TPA: trypsin-like peptidase domain-containing protein [Thermoleophilaceae bacterium]|nr:trypsin-like peptidase domain-containing protein [Thermoleophilaceae bacterium]
MTNPITNLLSGLLGGLLVLIAGAILISTDVIETGDSRTVVQRQSPTTQPSSDEGGRTVRDIYAEEGRGVVFISAQGVSDSNPLFGAPQEGTATGSGFVVDDDGTILTNAHVVEDADQVTVSFEEGGEEIEAEVKGVDPSTDLAALKVDPSDVEDLHVLRLGDSSKLEVGDPLIAIGNPFGFSRTVTTGIVSALQRDIPAPDGFRISGAIQTDASINPGNSGGPLLDAEGRVIGINSQIATGGGRGSVGIGFAVPVNTAKQLLPQLRKGGEIERAYLGIQMSDVNEQVAEELDLPVDQGALVVEATEGGPAEEAGMRGGEPPTGEGGDVLVKVDGKEISSADDVAAAIADNQPGDEIEVELYRDGDKETVPVELGKRPESFEQPMLPEQPDEDDDGGLLPLP